MEGGGVGFGLVGSWLCFAGCTGSAQTVYLHRCRLYGYVDLVGGEVGLGWLCFAGCAGSAQTSKNSFQGWQGGYVDLVAGVEEVGLSLGVDCRLVVFCRLCRVGM